MKVDYIKAINPWVKRKIFVLREEMDFNQEGPIHDEVFYCMVTKVGIEIQRSFLAIKRGIHDD